MAAKTRAAAFHALRRSSDFTKLLAMMFLSFTVIFVVGVVRPIRDALALDGLGAGDFYQVYFVSAVVVLFVPLYNRLADRIPWKRLIPGVALFFAASMVFFRVVYRPGSGTFGMVFYGWYDLMVAALVTQFFMATQVFYNARDAKRAYPLVIAAGSIGAAIGGAITAFFAQRLGTPNLLLVAGAAIVVFAVGIALVWRREDPESGRPREREPEPQLSTGELRRIFSNRQVRLIAATVLLTVLVKQFVDYEYKTLTGEVFDDLDSVSGFLGLVDAATQWLPILVLLALRPILQRWGAGVTVLIFPVAMIVATGALATVMTLPVAVFARTTEKMFRYSAERTGREILYVPVPDAIKLRAKAYIDLAVEKGIGKVLSGVVILVLVSVTGAMSVVSRLVLIGFVGIATAVLLLLAFLKVRQEYVKSLADSIEGRFASLRGTFVSLLGPGPREMVGEALRSESPLKVAFALDLIEQGEEEDAERFMGDLESLLDDDRATLRMRALQIIARAPHAIPEDRIRPLLHDDDGRVRRQAVRVLLRRAAESPDALVAELLDDPDPGVRSAAFASLADEVPETVAERVVTPFFRAHVVDVESGDPHARRDLAAAARFVPAEPDAARVVQRLVDDPDDDVASAAVLSAGRIGSDAALEAVIRALGSPRTSSSARVALASRGDEALEPLLRALESRSTDPAVRRAIPRALGEIETDATVEALIEAYMRPETEQILDDRALAALARLRAAGNVSFPDERVLEAVDREVLAATRYAAAANATAALPESRVSALASRAFRESAAERRAAIFRWLGLVYPQHGMTRSHLAIETGEDRTRANAVEWLESTIGHTRFVAVRPAFETTSEDGASKGNGLAPLAALWDDEDAFVASLALWASREADPSGTADRLAHFEPRNPELRLTVERLRETPRSGADTPTQRGTEMDLIEKVFLLQNVDLLQGVHSQQLALLASIADVLDAEAGRRLLSKDEPTDAMYVVISGDVSLVGVGGQPLSLGEGAAFGTWALIDRDPSLLEARAETDCRLLRIRRSDFRDLLVDYPELGVDLLEGLAKRLRSLAVPA